MPTNHVPKLSQDNPTGCCPRFNPKEWDGKTFEFKDKPFVRMVTNSFFYMPLNLGPKMAETWKAIAAVQGDKVGEFVCLTYDLSPWKAEHLLSVAENIPGLENIKISGKFKANVFEGPYQDAPKWIKAMNTTNKVYLYYTTCPKCMKFYGKNYVVAFAKIS